MKKGVQLAKRLSPSLSTILNLNASTHSLLSSSPWWSASQHRGVKVNAIHDESTRYLFAFCALKDRFSMFYSIRGSPRGKGDLKLGPTLLSRGIVESEHKQRGRGGALMQ
ncbi:hypothetical protein Golob_010060, partial [Gossypium lobatum]|nr:hypothetical protein [Gossypium lobatum]